MANTIDLKLSIEDLQIIDAALAEMPYRIAAPVIQRMNQQLQDQSNAIDSDKERSNGQT